MQAAPFASTADGRQPLRSRIFDYGVVSLGLAMVLAAVSSALSADEWPHPGYWLAALVIAVVERYPMTLFARTAAVHVSFSSCVAAFLGIVVDLSSAMLIWSAGVLLAQVVSRVRRSARVFNFGVALVSGGIGLVVIELVRDPSDAVSPSELGAVALGCAVTFLVDYLLSEVSVAFEERSPIATQLLTPGMAVALGGVVTVDTVGYLAAIIDRLLPPQWLALLVVPVAALLAAATSRNVSIESSRRLGVMVAASSRMQGAETREEVLRHLDDALQELVRGSEVALREEPPGPGEIGERLEDGNVHLWLVTPGLWRAHPDPSLDSQHLGSLARTAGQALARVRMRAVVTRLAESDPLTGLCNRAVFLQRVDDALASSRASASGHMVAVLFCDLDGFKRVNDWFGHAVGDELLIGVARSLQTVLGPEALVARLGGDEFAVLLCQLATEDDLTRQCQAVLAAVERRFEYHGRSVLVSTSVGIARSSGRHTADQLIRNADLAMYAAKFAGKNRFREYHPAIGRNRVQTLELAEALNRAVSQRALTVVYQPVVSAASGRVMGLEALARWQDAGRDVPPDVFIPLAEEHGLIDELGELVLDIVAADAPALEAASSEQLAIGVNVSSLQLHTPRLVSAVRRTRQLMGRTALVLELTERQVVGDDDAVLQALDVLQSDEVRLALDDFGVGFSSIGYLQRLAVRILKIDRQFSAGIDRDPRALRLLQSMVEMSRAMDLDVVIEGVERPEQLAVLLPHIETFAEYVYLQGYLLGRPMPLEQVLEHMAGGRSLAPVLTH
ncbi:MAG: diguanylate cyclase/phosphodiesterase (GGDEF & EAL domains) with PAS/PAC sensor(s) [uncultured Nocardioidaceae bacterium]|uniref:Diguanylate cyclase/phosphodiesterase (GGDEF & EAL domains) with PAS/PAC sensor(S) n=1 Tax=uncultured Nocardioidaceae bacterium TaxID=253824 RepID=A0A6J4LI22_9ACTN|nr:MAG: diguanylate cyclase/phosphodiesterase (GGDEF & EAL domains) with PAS/PAC sensor(s) [uncultured Nocardioidaceae bacterium]